MNKEEWQNALIIGDYLAVLTPEDPGVHHCIGVSWFHLKNYKKAEQALQCAENFGDKRAGTQSTLANICSLQGDLDGVIARIKKAIVLDPHNVYARFDMAVAYLGKGELREAEAILIDVINHYPDNAQARSGLADIYFSEGKLDQAEEQLREAIKRRPGIGSLHGDLGYVLTRKGDNNGALNAFTRASALRPELPIWYYEMGNAQLALGNPEEAASSLARARKMDYYNPRIYYALGRSFLDSECYEECVKANETALALHQDPDMKLGRTNLGLNITLNLGIANLELEKYDEAKACFQRNLLLVAPTYFNLGLTLYRECKVEECLEYFKRAIELEPDNPKYLVFLGEAYSELNCKEDAKKMYEKAIEVDDTYIEAHFDLGQIITKMGNREEALPHYFRAIELDEDYPPPYYDIACNYAVLGKKKKALDFLKKAVEKKYFFYLGPGKGRPLVDNDPDWDTLRDDKTFIKIVETIAD